MIARKARIRLAAGAVFGMLLCVGCDDGPVTVATPPPNVTARDGIGIALVVDCSGSMAARVDDNGQTRPKDEIARRCVGELVKRCEDFQTKNQSRVVELGIFKFDDTFETALDFAKPSVQHSTTAVSSLVPSGGTAIGRAILRAKEKLDLTGLSSKHIVLVTDGQNTEGVTPNAVANALKALPESERPAVYVVAFDTNADNFQPLKSAGWMVLSASNGKELQLTLDTVFGENILLER